MGKQHSFPRGFPKTSQEGSKLQVLVFALLPAFLQNCALVNSHGCGEFQALTNVYAVLLSTNATDRFEINSSVPWSFHVIDD